MYKRAIVPLDGSAVAETVIPFILEIAGPLDMAVVLLRVLQPAPPMAIEGTRHVEREDIEARRTNAEDYLAPIASELRAKGIRVDTRVRIGVPAEHIVAAAREEKADIIAMSTHGRSGFSRLLFGSVAEAVLRHSETPLFLMRATQAQVVNRAAHEVASH